MICCAYAYALCSSQVVSMGVPSAYVFVIPAILAASNFGIIFFCALVVAWDTDEETAIVSAEFAPVLIVSGEYVDTDSETLYSNTSLLELAAVAVSSYFCAAAFEISVAGALTAAPMSVNLSYCVLIILIMSYILSKVIMSCKSKYTSHS